MAEKKLDIENLPNNSHRAKAAQEFEEDPAVKQKALVSHPGTIKKPSLAARFARAFIAEDVTDVKSYILSEVVVPAVKDTIVDVATTFIERLMFGGGGGYSHKRSSIPSKVSYQSYYDKPAQRKASLFYSDARSSDERVLLDSRKDAEIVLDKMGDVIDRYGTVSVADYYEFVGVPSEFTDNKYGWSDISSARVCRDGRQYYIDLPRSIHLD